MSPQTGFLCVFSGEPKTFKECLDCSRSPQHCEFTPEMMALMSRGGRRKANPDNPSVTAVLGGCFRQTVIKDRHDYRVSPRKSWYLLRGNMVHQIMEGTMMKDGWKELYHSRALTLPNGRVVRLGGIVDKLVPEQLLIRDYKTTRRLPKKDSAPYGKHGLQLNAYRWIWWPIFRCEKLRISYIDMTGTRQIKVALIDIDEMEKILSERAYAYVTALEGADIPEGGYDTKNWICRYCDVADICKKLKEEQNDTKEGTTSKETSS